MALKYTLLVLPLFLAPSVAPALAGDVVTFIAQEYGWRISGVMGQCTAQNRPFLDFGVAPYNGLVLSQAAGSGDVYTDIHFWPGALPADGDVTISIGPYHAGQDFAATSTEGYVARLLEPVPASVLEEWHAAAEIYVSAPGVDQLMGFDVESLAKVLVRLNQCAMSISPN